MFDPLIDKLTPYYSNLKNRGVFLILSAVSLFVRFPFFFRDYIDRDESTFILMGQSWVDGYLPYTELWDLKPPITYLFFASIIYVFGKSFLVIRFFGALIVAITAFYTYKIAETTTTKKVALWIGVGCVALQSMFGSLQGVMSEHISMVFFVPALFVLIRYRKFYWYWLAGLLMGLSLMTKLNMAYAVLFLGLFILYRYLRNREYEKAFLNGAFFATGVLLIIFATFLPYYLNGSSEIWWQSVVLAPLKYTGARRYSLIGFLPILVTLGTFFYFTWKKNYLNYKNSTIQFLTVAILGVLFSFIQGGRVNGHYLIQLHPLLIVLVGILISKLPYLKTINYRPFVLFLLLLLPAEAYLEYVNIIKNKIQRGTFYNGEGITVPKYITKNTISTENILFLGYHIGYWSLNTKPPTKSATHPSNICRKELFPFYNNDRKTHVEELKYIMETIQPQTVVIRQNRSIFDPKLVKENAYIKAKLQQFYMLSATVDKAEIYQRLK